MRLAVRAGLFAAATAVLSLPALIQLRGYLDVTTGVVTAAEEVGNLIGPLNPLQVVGIWINGDYRLQPGGSLLPLSRLLIVVALVAAALGVAWAVRRRAWAVLLYAGSSLLACAIVVAAGSPWADGKAYAIASPAVLFVALLGVAAVIERQLLSRSRAALASGVVAAAALVAGVLLSNAFAYRDVKLAPHDRLAELQRIGQRSDLDGPLLTTEFEEFAKHFLRRADPSGVSDAYSPRPVDPAPPGRAGPRFGFPSDLDELALPYVEAYRTLVVRRSPVASRPPSDYRRVWQGRWYELWERDPGAPRVAAHLPLGSDRSAGSIPRCEQVRALADAAAAAGGRLAYVPRGRQPAFFPTDPGARAGARWGVDRAQPLFLRAAGPGSIDGTLRVARAGDYELWLGGSFGGLLRIELDGREVGQISHELSGRGQYALLGGPLRLTAGEHAVRIVRGPRSLAPGATASTIGPLVLTTAADGPGAAVRTLDPARWRSLCGRSLDWVEATSG
jgi:hypothetical protein